ncbi:MAG: F0F1 ATP synthase subunit alpha, partial [Bacteroidales bacterium]|nr:F0F1 ATP synthase subunit alpha [Bacteroidales bacterium]
KFGSDLDAATKAVLDKGARNVEILKQPQYSPMPVEEQVAIIFCGTNGLLQKVPVDKVRNFETESLFMLKQNHADLLANLKAGKLLDADIATMRQVAADLSGKYAK